MTRRRQCAKCPWKKSTNPRDIPNGYSEELHASLDRTIAKNAALIGGALRMMACHESVRGRELPCVGWLHHQLGVGNNIPLRLAAIEGRVDPNVQIVGAQHERFEDTLPAPVKKVGRR